MNVREIREKYIYNSQSLKRTFYQSLLSSHSKAYYSPYIMGIIGDIFSFANGKKVLELGSASWCQWIYRKNIKPKELVCINISETELNNGIKLSKQLKLNIRFKIMSANKLQFPDNEFDVVYGGEILHHLDFPKAIIEVYRVLKKDGQIVFREPLNINPVSKIIRFFTPNARTRDESPLRFRELRKIEDLFETKFYYEQLFSVPLGLVSRAFFSKPKNIITKTAFLLDRFVEDKVPPVRPFFRDVLIHGKKKH